jgi:hypothetical protein
VREIEAHGDWSEFCRADEVRLCCLDPAIQLHCHKERFEMTEVESKTIGLPD